MHYASVATRSGIFLSAHFYTAVICGLTLPIKLIASRSSSLLTGKYRARRRGQDTFGLASSGSSTSLRRIHIAESLFDAMRENNIDAPTKAYHALMYAWALLGQPHKVQEYFDMIERAAAIAPAGISEVTWGILLYSHARAHDVHGALGVLVRAREWVFSAGRGAVTKAASRTSYLVNISVCALLVDRDASSALSLLDSCILRYDEYLQRKESRPGGWELPATPADPATRSLIVRALLDNQKLTQAMEVYDAIHAQYDIPESASELKPMLQFCLGQADVHCALQIAERVLQVGGVGALTESQWTRLFYLCIQGQKDDAFVKVLDNVSALRVGSSGTCVFEAEVAPMLKRTYPGAVEWFCRALRRGGRAGEAASIESCLATAAQTPPAKPTMSTRAILPPSHEPSNHAHCISLYRDLLRAIRTFPLAELRRKLKYNARFSFELYRDLDTNSPKIQQLIRGGRIQLEWLTSWHNDPETCQKLVHKHMAPK
ncbi:hypothetical protein H4R26_003558 [Coemansia thaxteri]|uniref:Complex 1 LYR protein domain-containing protein n=1 Tax=Coemansia thaxteri TaxID=2663907 RepID=A0A9W8BHV1_9FUNG|nr:hypothetical protein H4R26_003558 [Coemansia thaxteri]